MRTRRSAGASSVSEAMPCAGRASITASPRTSIFPNCASANSIREARCPWLGELEAASEAIGQELETVMAAERAELVPYIQYEEHQPLDQWRELNRNPRLDRNPFDQERRPGRSECKALSAHHGAARATAAATRSGRRPERDVFLARPPHPHPGSCRSEQRAARLSPAAGHPRRLLVQGRGRDPHAGARERRWCSTTRSNMRR